MKIKYDIAAMQNSLNLIGFILDMTMEELAEELGVSRGYMCELANNKKPMTRQMAMALLYILKRVTYYSNDEKLGRGMENTWNRMVIVDAIREIVTGEYDVYYNGKQPEYIKRANEYIANSRKYKIDRETKLKKVHEILEIKYRTQE